MGTECVLVTLFNKITKETIDTYVAVNDKNYVTVAFKNGLNGSDYIFDGGYANTVYVDPDLDGGYANTKIFEGTNLNELSSNIDENYYVLIIGCMPQDNIIDADGRFDIDTDTTRPPHSYYEHIRYTKDQESYHYTYDYDHFDVTSEYINDPCLEDVQHNLQVADLPQMRERVDIIHYIKRKTTLNMYEHETDMVHFNSKDVLTNDYYYGYEPANDIPNPPGSMSKIYAMNLGKIYKAPQDPIPSEIIIDESDINVIHGELPNDDDRTFDQILEAEYTNVGCNPELLAPEYRTAWYKKHIKEFSNPNDLPEEFRADWYNVFGIENIDELEFFIDIEDVDKVPDKYKEQWYKINISKFKNAEDLPPEYRVIWYREHISELAYSNIPEEYRDELDEDWNNYNIKLNIARADYIKHYNIYKEYEDILTEDMLREWYNTYVKDDPEENIKNQELELRNAYISAYLIFKEYDDVLTDDMLRSWYNEYMKEI